MRPRSIAQFTARAAGAAVVLAVVGVFVTTVPAAEPVAIGSRRELMVDEFLLAKLTGARLVLHRPVARELALVHDRPWEGNTSAYHTVFQDGPRYRMYYRGSHYDHKLRKSTHAELVCTAESKDAVHWTRPELGIVAFAGSKKNNIVWSGVGCHDFAPFKDTNPKCTPGEKYKAIGRGKGGLYAFKSSDGLHWSLISDRPVITKGAFDSQNLAFYDTLRGQYVEFHRNFRKGYRDIMTCTSANFRTWTDPVWLSYPGAPTEHLYTNQITPYFRAPHIYMGFPKRFQPQRKGKVFGRAGVSDGVFMTSRDGRTFRRWTEAFVRPGPQKERWVNRNNMTAWGIVVTTSAIPGTPDELSIYSTEHYYQGPACKIRRYTLRTDGFVSLRAPLSGGTAVTKPITFQGKRLGLNYATSAAGSVRVEIQDAAGKPIAGYALADCPETYGDEIDGIVAWKNGPDVSKLAGKPVRLRFVLKDADLYAFRFR